MRLGRRRVVFAAGLLATALLGAAFLEYRNGYVSGYHLPGAPLVRSPSLRLDLEQLLGLQQFHSQLGQDKWIVGRVFPDLRDGYFVDVGSWDAVVNSNTKALEDLGWDGVCIDPFPRNWKDRRCQLFREVAYAREGEKIEFRLAGPLSGIDDHIGLWKERVRGGRVLELTTTTLADILARARAPRRIHYVSIDVEGAELEVLRGFPFSEYTVGAFTIEHNFETDKRAQIRALLEGEGYRLEFVDDWYVRADAPS